MFSRCIVTEFSFRVNSGDMSELFLPSESVFSRRVNLNLSSALALRGNKVGLLDVDLHGPSIPQMLHLNDVRAVGDENAISPIEIGNLKVMSVGALLENADEPIIWRGPMKIGVIKQLLSEVEWGDLTYLELSPNLISRL